GKIVENDGVPITVADLGMPARDSLVEILRRNGDIWIETSRGCGWGQCAFCFKDPFRAHKWEPFPDDVVLDGLEYLHKMGARHVSLTDPEFFGGGKETLRGIRRAQRLANEMIKRGIKLKIAFSCRADSLYKKNDAPDIARERIETFKLMRTAGFESAFVGVESGSEKQLVSDFTKGVTVEENEMTIKLLREMDFEICAGFIPLDPYATLETLQENIDFVRRNDLYLEVSFPLNQLKVQANTKYYTRTLDDGLLGKRRDTLHTYNCRYKYPDVQKIADMINEYGREVGSVFYVLKYMHRTENLNRIAEEDIERETLKHFFVEYNKMEIDFLEALVKTVQDTGKLADTINEFRKCRLNLVLQLEEKIKSGTIKDRNKTLTAEIEKIRPILNNFVAGKLTDVSVEAVMAPLAAEGSAIDKVAELLKGGYPASVESLKKLVVYSAMVKEEGGLSEIQDIPAAEIARQLELFIDISDDLETIALYKTPSDAEFITQDGAVDYSKLQLIASFKSNHLVFPDNYIAKHYSGELLSRILILFMRGGKYTKYRGTVTTHDSRMDLDVWSTSIDTVYMHKVLAESGILNSDKIKTAAEIGVGGGHLSTVLAQNLKELKNLIITDISAYALMAAKRNILPFAKKQEVKLTTYLGKGIKTLGRDLDLLLVNPPYIPVPPWEKANGTAIDDPYKGTGLIREIIEDGINHLNPDNPDASIIMNYSSLAADDFKEYMRAYGKLVDVETIAGGFEVPLKIERVDSRWINWMRGRGLIVKEDAPEDGFKYWHTLNVVRIKPKRVAMSYKDGRTEPVMLHNLKLEKEEAARWNGLTLASKLEILSLLRLEPKDYLWFDDEWRDLYQVVKYYQVNTGKLKGIIEKQLDRKIFIDETDLLQSFYLVDDGFFSSNVIRHIYFTGKNPHVSPQAIQAL
ncbi:MAG: radical SAM protein, partial [Candidatus Omnitrophota bacterium]|nr:radical SAM protein [Candidatus Omnitrophota bacterium]